MRTLRTIVALVGVALVCAPVAQAQSRQRGFSVVLIVGDTQTATTAVDNAPAGARKALTDVKDFLPYKGYRVLDTQWIAGSKGTTRVHGLEDQEYDAAVTADEIL